MNSGLLNTTVFVLQSVHLAQSSTFPFFFACIPNFCVVGRFFALLLRYSSWTLASTSIPASVFWCGEKIWPRLSTSQSNWRLRFVTFLLIWPQAYPQRKRVRDHGSCGGCERNLMISASNLDCRPSIISNSSELAAYVCWFASGSTRVASLAAHSITCDRSETTRCVSWAGMSFVYCLRLISIRL